MRALTTTSSVLRVVCDTNADLDCHASSVDLTLSTPTPGAQWTLDVDSSVPSTVGGLFFAMASSNTACGTRVDTGTMLAPARLRQIW